MTPYLHALIDHLPEMMDHVVNHSLELAWFSASAQEKKNHLQVSYYHSKTFRGGLDSAEVERSIMMDEGRRLLFIQKHQTELLKDFDPSKLLLVSKPTKINVK